MLAAIVGVLCAVCLFAAPAHASEGPYRLQNGYSGKCLVVFGGAAWTQAVQYTCANYADQNWSLISGTTEPTAGLFRIRNSNSGLCLVATSSGNGAAVQQAACSNFMDQYWIRRSVSNSYAMTFENVARGGCLTVVASSANAAPAILFDCHDYQDQWWWQVTP